VFREWQKWKNSARDVSGESNGNRSFRIYTGKCRRADACKIYLKKAEYKVITRFTCFEKRRSVHLLWTW
jgi:hypothetical protein